MKYNKILMTVSALFLLICVLSGAVSAECQIDISLYGAPLSDVVGKTVSVESGLNFTITPDDGKYPSALLFTNQNGIETVSLGNAVSTKAYSSTNNVFSVESLKSENVITGTWTVQALYSDNTKNTAEKLFAGIDTDNHAILGFNPQTKSWEQIGKDALIESMTGYWIYSKTIDTIEIEYPSSPSSPPTKTVYKGWNAVGLSANEQTSAKSALANINWATVIEWNSVFETYNTAIVNGGSDANSPDRLITPGNGFWLYANEDGTMIGLTA